MGNISAIVNNELCTGCGLCISESTNGKMIWNEKGFLVPDINSVFSNNAIKLCPFNPNPQSEVQDEDKLADLFLQEANKRDDKVGKYINTYVGYSKEYRETSSSGGIATYLFEQLLKRRIVDYLYIVKEVNGTYEYQLFSDFKEIKKISKTRYIPVTLADLFKQIDKIDGKVALSGVACFIKAVRLKQYYNPELKDKIPFLIGIICGGLKSRFFTDYLAQVAGIDGDYSNQNYRIKDANSTSSDYSFGAFDAEDVFKSVKMSVVGDMWGTGLFKSNACDFCTDVTTELADISLGDAWLEPYRQEGLGNNVVVCRSNIANNLIEDGIKEGTLKINHLSFKSFLSSQGGSFKHRHSAVKYRIKKSRNIKPYVRRRLLVNIPYEFRRVQNKRMDLRRKSLTVWKKSPNYELFESNIASDKKTLATLTYNYHVIQKIRRILKLRTL